MTPPAVPEQVLAATERATRAGFTMSCDPDTGRLLAVLAARTPTPGRLLELGTGTGVGTAWLLHGLRGRNDVELITVEHNPAIAELTDTSAWPDWAHIVVDDAVIVTERSGTFDFIFADAQGGKWDHLDTTIAALGPGATLLVDDMTPTQFVDDTHAEKTEQVRHQLLNHPALVSVEIDWSTGLILCTKRHET
jgi:predicted O-methyltransferase YrrM